MYKYQTMLLLITTIGFGPVAIAQAPVIIDQQKLNTSSFIDPDDAAVEPSNAQKELSLADTTGNPNNPANSIPSTTATVQQNTVSNADAPITFDKPVANTPEPTLDNDIIDDTAWPEVSNSQSDNTTTQNSTSDPIVSPNVNSNNDKTIDASLDTINTQNNAAVAAVTPATDQNNTAAVENTDAESSDASWFNGSLEPEILKKRQKKTKFGKHDRFYGKHLCDNDMYTCMALKKGDNWKNLFPDRYQRELVQRINRTNQGLWNRSWILVPNDINRNYMDFSPLPDFWENDGQKTIVVDVSELAFGAYDEDGDLVYWGPVNPGQEATQTVHGTNFQVYRKGGANCWSKKFEAAIPYCIFFHKGYAIHGFSMPGYAASHGCVRVNVDDALWLNKNFVDLKTKVIVQK